MKTINKNLFGKSGIYIITNTINGKRYIGSSKNIYERLNHHVWDLNSGTHINKHLQNAWNKYGEDAFEYGILLLCPESNRLEQEGFFIEIINPEYNIDEVNLNGDTVKSIETKQKIATAVYNNWETESRQSKCKSRAIKCYVYSIKDWKLYVDGKNILNTAKFLGLKYNFDSKFIDSRISGEYAILSKKYDSLSDLKNFVCKNLIKYNSKNFKEDKYLIAEYNNELHYYKTIQNLLDDIKCSCKSTICAHYNATKEHPYIPKNTDIKIYFSTEFIKYKAVPIEKSSELLSGNIGGKTLVENTEINSEIAKGSESSYSVESE